MQRSSASRRRSKKSSRGFCASLFTIPNEFEEDVAKQRRALSGARFDAHESSLVFLGKALTASKYVAVLCAVAALTTVLALRESQLVMEVFPRSPAEVAALKVNHPNTRCECSASSFPQSDFSTPVVEVVSACDWVIQDLAKVDILDQYGQTTSGCGDQFLQPCKFVADACTRSNRTINWIKAGFNDHVFTSTELLEEEQVRSRLEGHLEANLQIGELISTGPQETVEAWAAQNMPKIVDMAGDVAKRVKLLSMLHNQAHTRIGELQAFAAAIGTEFVTLNTVATAAGFAGTSHTNTLTAAAGITAVSTAPITEWVAFKARCGLSTAPTEIITKPDGSTFASTGACDPDADFPETTDDGTDGSYKCFTEECLWGGHVDRESRKLDEIYASPYPNVTRVSAFDMYDAKYPYRVHTVNFPVVGYPKGSWLDAENDPYVVPESRRDCTTTGDWLENEPFPAASLYTKDVLLLVKNIYDSTTYTLPDRHFRPANRGGCDQYSLMLDSNYFQIDNATVVEAFFDFFIADVRRMGALVANGDTSILNNPATAQTFVATCLASVEKLKLGKEFVMMGLDGLHYSSTDNVAYRNIRQAMEHNFVNTSRVDLRYDEYFAKCDIKACTHLVDARMTTSALMSILLGIIGGFWSVIEIITRTAYLAGRRFILRRSRDDDDEEDDEPDEDPKGSKGSFVAVNAA